MSFVGLVPSCLRGSEIFSRGSWVPRFFSWVFRGFQIFSRWYFMGPKEIFIGISWVENFLLRAFCVSNIFLVDISWETREFISEEYE